MISMIDNNIHNSDKHIKYNNNNNNNIDNNINIDNINLSI